MLFPLPHFPPISADVDDSLNRLMGGGDLKVVVFGCKQYLCVYNKVADSHKREQHILVRCALGGILFFNF